MIKKLKALASAALLKLHAYESTPVGEQVFRIVRLAAFAVASDQTVVQFVHGQADFKAAWAAGVIALEVTFRKAVPTAGTLWYQLTKKNAQVPPAAPTP